MIHKGFLLRKVAWQQGVTALLLYQAQTVAFRPQKLRIPKKTVRSLFLILKDVELRRQMAVYFMVMLLPYQKQDRSPGNHRAIGITAHVDCECSE